MLRRCAILLVLTIAQADLAHVQAQVAEPPADHAQLHQVTDEAFRLALDAETSHQIHALVARLGSPVYDEREQAAAELTGIGIRAFGPLRETYHACEDLDTRLRIEAIVFEAYVDDQLYLRTGFLGIRSKSGLVTSDSDKRVPAGRMGIELAEVVRDTAAERAGLQPNDVILALEGEPIGGKALPGFEAFAEAVRTSGPGTTVALEVVRTRHLFQVQATLGRLPKGSERSRGPVRELYLQTLQDFDVWWRGVFRRAAPSTAGDE